MDRKTRSGRTYLGVVDGHRRKSGIQDPRVLARSPALCLPVLGCCVVLCYVVLCFSIFRVSYVLSDCLFMFFFVCLPCRMFSVLFCAVLLCVVSCCLFSVCCHHHPARSIVHTTIAGPCFGLQHSLFQTRAEAARPKRVTEPRQRVQCLTDTRIAGSRLRARCAEICPCWNPPVGGNPPLTPPPPLPPGYA
jgi:hypothetical protein